MGGSSGARTGDWVFLRENGRSGWGLKRFFGADVDWNGIEGFGCV